jgi:asparagine synthase (glutamine-hydrolysing)
MCGIAGIVSRNDVYTALDRMVTSMGHRGPDARGAMMQAAGGWTLGLGHNRLAILDLSPLGSQPMTDCDSRAVICYNGEVYNFMDLREELVEAGVTFKSRTDTEVILEGYLRWGLDVFARLRGMFALAIWDPAKRKLVLARDSLGIKPLYIYFDGNVFLFASEVRGLLASGLVPKKLDSAGIASYLSFGSVSAPRTIVEGVESLMPGDCVEVIFADETPRVCRSRFRAQSKRRHAPQNRAQAVEELGDLLTDSVERHLVSDVPVGLFLSGGIDSTAIAAILGKRLKRPLQSFNVAFSEQEFAEDKFATDVAKLCGTEHTHILLREDEMADMMPNAIRSMDQPTMDGVNTWVVSKAVAEAGVKVALSGLGGDELFCGYSSFRRAQLLNRIRRVPRPMRAVAATAGRALFDGTVKSAKFWDMLDSEADAAVAYALSRRLFSPTEVRALSGLAAPEPVRPESMADVINSVSVLETQGYMTNTLLRDTDFMAMAHSLEVRVPFVDVEVADYVMRLPGYWKMERNRPKPLLLDALGELIPEQIWKRPKMGFTLPFRKWMASSLSPAVEKVLGRNGSIGGIGLQNEAASAVWNTFKTSPERERWSRPWSLFVLQRWCEVNEVTV